MSAPIHRLTTLQRHVFLLNSRLDLFTAPPIAPAKPERRRGSFSRSYGSNLPSSLAMIRSSTLGYSPHPPVSVWGTALLATSCDVFLGSCSPLLSACPRARRTVGARPSARGFTCGPACPFNPAFRRGAGGLLLRCASAYHGRLGSGILNRFAIAFALRLRLRCRLTLIRLALIRNPWMFGVPGSHRDFVTYAYSFASSGSTAPHRAASVPLECSPTPSG